jgi:hypothetical protein
MKTMMIGAVLAAGLAASASGQISMREVQRIDLFELNNDQSNTFIGTNVAAIAWNGSDLFAAGFNGAAASGTGVARYSGGSFQLMQFISGTPGARGFSGLDISGDRLAAAYDDGAADAQGLQVFDTGTNAVLWSKNIRGGSGVAFDPGFGGAGSGVAWTTFGQGRRFLQDTETGADIYGGSAAENGMIISPDFEGSFWRDMDFAANGNMVARRSNDVTFLSRTGPNAGSASLLVENNENGPFIAGQNVAYVDNSAFGDFVIWNDRTSNDLGQSAADALRVTDLDGNSLSLSLELLGGGSLADGNGWYDFSWDAASGTLAVLDFANRNVHIFQVPAPGAAGLLGLAGLTAARRRR